VPIPYGSKNPGDICGPGWQNLRLSEDEIRQRFNGRPLNIGVLLGEPSGWLVDIDLDCIAAIELASKYLPETPARFGRQSKPLSHWLYRVTSPVKSKQFRSKVFGTLLEIRSTALQTVFPPSVHPSGEEILWQDEARPTEATEIPPDQLIEAVEPLVAEVRAVLQVDRADRCLTAIMRMEKVDHNDGSNRLFAAACRVVEHDLRDNIGVAVIRKHAEEKPFPKNWTDDEIVRRIRDAEGKTERGKVSGRTIKANLPEIEATCQDLSVVTSQAWDALQRANKPERLFRHGGRLVRIETGDQNEPVIRDLSVDRARHELARAARWFKWKKTGAGKTVRTEAKPPVDVVKDMLATPDPVLPRLSRVVEVPVFGPDGSLQLTPGYHAGSRTYYAPAVGFELPPVPEVPSQEEIEHAGDLLLNDLLRDFPFTSEAERANAVGLFLLPFARDLIDGCTPLHLLEKPSPGTGATLLVDSMAHPATGRPIEAMTEGRDEDEWRKRITAKLRSGSPFVLIDNLKRRLDSAAVSCAITSRVWEDRVLGVTEMIHIPVKCVWIATGNNPALSSEITRRTTRIRLDAKTDRPWLRREFKHPNLRIWVQQNRKWLVWAALTLIRAWIVAGRPPGSVRLGMFEAWAETMGGILEVSRIDGFLGNLEEFYSESDAEGTADRAFVTAWWNQFSGTEVGVAELWQLVDQDVVDINLGDGSERSQKIRLGRKLAGMRDRTFTLTFTGNATPERETQVQVQKAGEVQRAQRWKLAEAT
jgi:hypothetical protein